MSNPFSGIKSQAIPQSLQVLSISNIDKLSKIMRIMPGGSFLCPDFTRYAVRSGGSDYFKCKIFDTQSDELIMETQKTQPLRLPSTYLQFNRDGSKVLFDKKIYDCNSSTIIRKIKSDFDSAYCICDAELEKLYHIRLKWFTWVISCVDTTNSKEQWFMKAGTPDSQKSIMISPNNSLIALYGGGTNEILIIDTSKQNVNCNITPPSLAWNMHFSLDGSSVFMTITPTYGSSENYTGIWSTSDGKCVYKDPNILYMTASSDNSMIFSVNKDGNILIYDVKQWKVIKEIQLDYDNYRVNGVSPNGLYRQTSLTISCDGKKLLIRYVGGLEIWGVY